MTKPNYFLDVHGVPDYSHSESVVSGFRDFPAVKVKLCYVPRAIQIDIDVVDPRTGDAMAGTTLELSEAMALRKSLGDAIKAAGGKLR